MTALSLSLSHTLASPFTNNVCKVVVMGLGASEWTHV
jgi:hypothetical protein